MELKQLIINKGGSMRAVAEAMDMSVQNLYMRVKNPMSLTIQQTSKLSKILDTPLVTIIKACLQHSEKP